MANIIEVLIKGNAASALSALQAVEQQSAKLAIVGGAITGALVASVRSFETYGRELDRMNKITGISVERLAQFRFAIEQEHGEFENLGPALRKFTQFLSDAGVEGSKASKIFQALGLDAKALREVPLDEAMMRFGQALRRVQDDSLKLALATEVLGKGAQNLIPFLTQSASAIEHDMDMARQLGLVISKEAAKSAEEFGDRLGELRGGLKAASITIGADLLPTVRQLVIEATNLVIKLSTWIRTNPELTTQIIKMAGALAVLLVSVAAVSKTLTMLIGTLGVLTANPWVIAVVLTLVGAAKMQQDLNERIRRAAEVGGVKLEVKTSGPFGGEIVQAGIVRTKAEMERLQTYLAAHPIKPGADASEVDKLGKALEDLLRKLLAGGEETKKTSDIIGAAIDAIMAWREESLAMSNTLLDQESILDETIRRLEILAKVAGLSKEAKAQLAEAIRKAKLELKEFQKAQKDAAMQLELDAIVQQNILDRKKAEEEAERNKQKFLENTEAIMTQVRAASEALRMADEARVNQIQNEIVALERRLELLPKTGDAEKDERVRLEAEIEGRQKIIDMLTGELATRYAILAIKSALGLATAQEIEDLNKLNELLGELQHKSALAGKALEENLKAPMQRLKSQLQDLLVNAFSRFFEDILTGAKSLGDALRNLFSSIVNDILRILARLAAIWFINFLFGLHIPLFGRGGVVPGHLIPIAQAATGAVFNRPTLAAVAEGGLPEAVVPLMGGRDIPVRFVGDHGAGAPVTVKTVVVFDPRQIPRPEKDEIVSVVVADIRQGGAIERTIRAVTRR